MRLNLFRFLFKWEDFPRQPKGCRARAVMRFTYIQLGLTLFIYIPSLFINYLPLPEFVLKFQIWTWVYGLIVGVIMNFFIENFPIMTAKSMSATAETLLKAATPIVSAILMAGALLEGGPLVFGYAFGEQGSYVFTVDRLNPRSRYCGAYVKVEELRWMLGGRICYVDHNIWETLNVGDKITVIGIKTPMGIRVQSVTLAKE